MVAGISGITDRLALGRNWQARRTSGPAFTRDSRRASAGAATGCDSKPALTRTRQVEQRPRPPHTEVWAMPAWRLHSSTEKPRGMLTVMPPG